MRVSSEVLPTTFTAKLIARENHIVNMLLTNNSVTQDTVVRGPLCVAHALRLGYLLSLKRLP